MFFLDYLFTQRVLRHMFQCLRLITLSPEQDFCACSRRGDRQKITLTGKALEFLAFTVFFEKLSHTLLQERS